ncbi:MULTISPECIES: ABC transporter substrate-binding protein [Protofrankia]|uniref:Leucine-binding protein domain-containing protein n=1 Tax=Candidatus Protofrankia datiscae TaxID=2716812 RepID=F8B091_9ACTN|nr:MULTISPECIES: ABC transporter substrate-binding protein [Protofrankia]AEH08715.1 hypothetical protein FsymDg_1225 [Candidatus Protofrankia datiscae]
MRARLLVIIAALSALVLSACGSRVDESSAPPSGPTQANTGANTASDTGVTTNDVKVGVIVGLTSPLGSETFSTSLYGAKAYFDALNAAGGVNGRKVTLVQCDDHGSGPDNTACARKLVDDEKVFALAGVSAFDYAGAQYLNSKGVPDVGGQPTSSAYDQYPHLYSIYGSYYPRDGRQPGYDGNLYAGTENYRWLKENLSTRVAGVVYYNVAPSQRYAQSVADGLRREGYTVVEKEINYFAPNFDAAVLDLKARGVDVIFDAMEDNGNLALCKSMQAQGLTVKAKMTTSQGWTDTFGQAFADTPNCRDATYATSSTRNYNDTNYPAVARFRADMAKYQPAREGKLSIWTLEGYASAQWLTDAIRSCGANVTRVCVEQFLNRPQDYDGDGLLTPRNFTKLATPPETDRNCINVARWEISANGGKGGWVTQVRDMNTNCFTVPNLPYPAE